MYPSDLIFSANILFLFFVKNICVNSIIIITFQLSRVNDQSSYKSPDNCERNLSHASSACQSHIALEWEAGMMDSFPFACETIDTLCRVIAFSEG